MVRDRSSALPVARRPLEAGAVEFRSGSRDRRLVVLVDLAIRAVELDAVAVGGDMRAGDHQRGGAQLQAVERQRRRRQACRSR
jgi:hypothetical protein